MRAAVLVSPNRLELREVPPPTPAADEVLVAVEACGLCGTDLKLLAGSLDPMPSLPRIPGHEILGRLVGDSAAGRAGERVACYIYESCGRCQACRRGEEVHCPHRIRLGLERDGGMAEFVAVKAANLLKVDESVSSAAAATAMDAVATPLAALRRAGVAGGEKLLVSGVGGLGLNATQLAVALGCTVVAVDPSRERGELAVRHGAVAAISASGLAGAERVLEEVGPVDAAIECSGHAEGFRCCVAAMRPRGRIVCCGYAAETSFSVPSAELVLKGLAVTGSLAASKRDAADALGFVSAGSVEPLVSHRFDLAQVHAAYATLQRGGALGRVVVEPAPVARPTTMM